MKGSTLKPSGQAAQGGWEKRGSGGGGSAATVEGLTGVSPWGEAAAEGSGPAAMQGAERKVAVEGGLAAQGGTQGGGGGGQGGGGSGAGGAAVASAGEKTKEQGSSPAGARR